MIDAFGLRHVSHPTYEADDFLGTYATLAEKAGYRVSIVTGDRDAFQLATEKVRIAIPHKGYQQTEYLGPKEIEAKYGIRPDQVASYKGLTGDSSDNLPGVRGIGPKGASALLQTYQTLTNLYDHIEEVKPVMRAKLLADKEQAFFCERMAQLVCDIPLPLPLEDLTLQNIPTAAGLGFFAMMEFSVLQRRLQSLADSPYGKAHFIQDMKIIPAQTPQVKRENQLSLFL